MRKFWGEKMNTSTARHRYTQLLMMDKIIPSAQKCRTYPNSSVQRYNLCNNQMQMNTSQVVYETTHRDKNNEDLSICITFGCGSRYGW